MTSEASREIEIETEASLDVDPSENSKTANTWWIYQGSGEQRSEPPTLPPAPPWRQFDGAIPPKPCPLSVVKNVDRGKNYKPSDDEREMVNAAIYLRRPLLVTGKPGSGKSTLAYSIAYELNLGPVLHWPITTRTTLQEGLYRYDAIARLQTASLDSNTPKIGPYIHLGPLGTALLPASRPRVLLIDEIDKSDIDLPNDLLNAFEEGQFEIPELSRLKNTEPDVEVQTYDGGTAKISKGEVRCHEFPIVIMTSNGERDFPPAFLRRCLRLTIQPLSKERLQEVIEARLDLGGVNVDQVNNLVNEFDLRRNGDQQELSTDQLLNAVYMVTRGIYPISREDLLRALFNPLTPTDSGS